MKMLETIHILPVRAESAAPAPLRGKKLDQRAVLQVVRKVDWKKAGLIAGGVTVVCAAAGTASRYKFYQGIVARALKKQLGRWRSGGDYWLSFCGPAQPFERIADAARASGATINMARRFSCFIRFCSSFL